MCNIVKSRKIKDDHNRQIFIKTRDYKVKHKLRVD